MKIQLNIMQIANCLLFPSVINTNAYYSWIFTLFLKDFIGISRKFSSTARESRIQ